MVFMGCLKNNYIKVIIFLFILLLLFSFVSDEVFASEREVVIWEPDVYILGDSNDELVKAYSCIVDAAGLQIEYVDNDEIVSLPQYSCLVVPSGYIKDDKTLEIIKIKVKDGLKLLFDSEGNLSDYFNIKWTEDKYTVSKVYDYKHSELLLNIGPVDNVAGIILDESMIALEKDEENDLNLAVFFSHGRGKCVFLANSPLDDEGRNYVNYPYLNEYITNSLDVKPQFSASRLAVFMDWGYYYDKDTDEVAEDYAKKGINEVHLSGWYDVNDYKVFLTKFIDSCHKNGILVYWWLELPMVSQSFFDKYPEYREKRANLEDAVVDWRRLIALDNKEAREAVFSYLDTFIDNYDFDGVDLAELYYEYPVEDIVLDAYSKEYTAHERWMASYFTPMNDNFRKVYEEKKGFDPYLLFDENSEYFFKNQPSLFEEFLEYRKELLTSLNEEFIKYFLDEERHGKRIDVIVTQIDSIFDETVTAETGVDSEAFLSLINKYELTFAIEDPFPLWKIGPSRYEIIAKNYYEIGATKQNINIDINIVNRNGFDKPNSKQTGVEFITLLSQAATYANQVLIYASNTPYEYDYPYVKYALAAAVSIDDEKITTDINTWVKTKTDDLTFFVDGKEWPIYSESGIMLLPGTHTVWKENKKEENRLHIEEINTEIKDCYYDGNSIIIEKNPDNPKAIYIKLNKVISKILLDGKEYKPQGYLCKDGNYRIRIDENFEKLCICEDNDGKINHVIVLNGKVISFETKPVLVNGRFLIPINELLETCSAQAEIHKEFVDPTIFASDQRGYVLWAQVGNQEALANGEKIILRVSPRIINGEIYFPMRFIYEAFGYKVHWTENGNRIDIFE